MTETDAKDWLPSHEAPDVVDRISAGLGIAGAIREENSIGLQREHVFGFGFGGNYRDLAAFAAQLAENVLLDAVIVRDYVEALRLVFDSDHFFGEMRTLAHFPNVGALGADAFRQVGTIHFRQRTRLGN